MASQKRLFQYHKQFVTHYMRFLTRFNTVKESVLPEGPLIFAANHPTTTDPFLLPILVNDPIHILVIETAFEVPLLGKLIAKAGHHRVSRQRGSGGKLIEQALESLRAGNHVGIFPEGMLSAPDGTMGHAHSGAARIALQSGNPVIPVGIHISPNAYIEKRLKNQPGEPPIRWIVRGSYYMTVGRPIHLEGDPNDVAQVQAASQVIMNAIQIQTHKSRRRMQLYPSNWHMVFRMIHRLQAIFS
jgi:1-acyl-sn-glycerol-3-phosphate acyltransferase